MLKNLNDEILESVVGGYKFVDIPENAVHQILAHSPTAVPIPLGPGHTLAAQPSPNTDILLIPT